MNNASIQFQFEDQTSADNAYETLKELGYKPSMLMFEQRPALQVHIEHSDLVSALEIAQAHGGLIVDAGNIDSNGELYSMAYNMEQLNIPAHMINEDWTDSYASGAAANQPEGPEDQASI